MRRALLLTAFDRPDHLREVLDSWAAVPEGTGWHVRVAVEPSPAQDEVLELVTALPDAEVAPGATAGRR